LLFLFENHGRPPREGQRMTDDELIAALIVQYANAFGEQ
jgi:hypothetical protein